MLHSRGVQRPSTSRSDLVDRAEHEHAHQGLEGVRDRLRQSLRSLKAVTWSIESVSDPLSPVERTSLAVRSDSDSQRWWTVDYQTQSAVDDVVMTGRWPWAVARLAAACCMLHSRLID